MRTDLEPVWAVIESRRTAMGLGIRELSRRTGLSANTIYGGLAGGHSSKWRNILLLVKLLGGKVYVTFPPVSGPGGNMALDLTDDADLEKALRSRDGRT